MKVDRLALFICTLFLNTFIHNEDNANKKSEILSTTAYRADLPHPFFSLKFWEKNQTFRIFKGHETLVMLGIF